MLLVFLGPDAAKQALVPACADLGTGGLNMGIPAVKELKGKARPSFIAGPGEAFWRGVPGRGGNAGPWT
jgi:hypothetical protein